MAGLSQNAPNLMKLAEQAYSILRQLFKEHEGKVLEIEILPSAFTPPEGQLVLVDDLNVGIPKKVLVAAFSRAREIFAARADVLDEKPSVCVA
jgi:microcompartment protein CcmK/EutM